MANYYVRADGTAGNKAAATGPDTDATKCMSLTTCNTESSGFVGGDRIKISDKGGKYPDRLIPLASGGAGNPIVYESIGFPVINGNGTHTLRVSARGNIDFIRLCFDGTYSYLSATSAVRLFSCIVKNSTSGQGGLYLDSNAQAEVYHSAVHGNTAYGIQATAGCNLRLRNTMIYGNGDRGIFTPAGTTLDYDYNIITGNSSSPLTNVNIGSGAVDGGHNILESAPRISSYKNDNAFFILTMDDNYDTGTTGQDGGQFQAFADALDPYGVPITFFVRTDGVARTGPSAALSARLIALKAQGHEPAVHCWSHTLMDRTQAFDVTTTNANPTCDVDVPTHTITLATTTPGNTVVLDWSPLKTIVDLQSAVVGKGWTITPKTSVQVSLLLSSLADSGGAQAVPYAPALDKTANGMFYYNEIAYPRSLLASILGENPMTYAYPGTVSDAGADAYLLTQGFLGVRANTSKTLLSLNVFDILTINLASFKGDGSETSVRRMANHFFTLAKDDGHLCSFLWHNTDDMSVDQMTWFVDEMRGLRVEFITLRDAVRRIRATHVTTDGITFTRSYPDQSDYTLLSDSDAVGAGIAVGITADYYGNPVPYGTDTDIGLHELQHAAADNYPIPANVKNGTVYGHGYFTGTYGAGTAGTPVRQQILDSLKTRLQVITTTNGYRTNLGQNVAEWDETPLDPDLETLRIEYRDEAGSVSADTVGIELHTLPVTLRILCQNNTVGAAAATIRNAVSDVRKALLDRNSDITLGGLAENTRQAGDMRQAYAEQADRAAGVVIPVAFEYTTDPGGF